MRSISGRSRSRHQSRKLARVVRQHEAEVGADALGVRGVARHARDVARLVLGRLGPQRRVGRDRRHVHVAVDLLHHPVRWRTASRSGGTCGRTSATSRRCRRTSARPGSGSGGRRRSRAAPARPPPTRSGTRPIRRTPENLLGHSAPPSRRRPSGADRIRRRSPPVAPLVVGAQGRRGRMYPAPTRVRGGRACPLRTASARARRRLGGRRGRLRRMRSRVPAPACALVA